MHLFEVLLLEIRGKTIAYASNRAKIEREREKIITSKIISLEKNISNSTVMEIEDLRKELEEFRKKKIEGIKVRSKAKWLVDGEKVSRYFCTLEKRNFVNKTISFLDKGNGVCLYKQTEILEEIKLFYEKLYSHKPVSEVDLNELFQNIPTLSDEDCQALEGSLTYQEALTVLKTMKNNKSPGPDGFTTEFFKIFFIDIGPFFVRSINEGFTTKLLSTTQRQGIITCIPKKGKPKQFIKNWRPISLLNVSYKIISACIARRLKLVLPKIIHECQKGFMKGRYIGENIRLIYDLISHAEKENIPGLILAVDFEKAFDSVSWCFLEKCLNRFLFPQNIIQWFKTLYEKPSTCVYINGQYSQWFPLKRGCRQGDPISPYLYLICAEVLSLMLRKNKKIKGIKVKDKEHLLSLFADDTTCFLDGSEESFKQTIYTLDKFAEMSGLKINNEKTQILWIGNRKKCQIKYMRDRNFQWDPGIFKVLGIQFSANVTEITELNYNGTLLQLQHLLNQWKRRKLTPLGRITVIKSIVLSKLTFLFTNLPDPPKAYLKQLEYDLFYFLWDGKHNKIKKSVVCKAYEEGGLRMCDIFSFLATMKISWLRRLDVNSSFTQFIKSLIPELDNIKIFGGEYVTRILSKLKNPFWADVLLHFKNLSSKLKPTKVSEFINEPLHYNKNIIRNKKIISLKQWINADILQVKDVINSDGTFLSYEKFRQHFADEISTDYLTYKGIIKAIKEYQKKCNLDCASSPYSKNKTDNLVWHTILKGNKETISIFLESDSVPTSCAKWKLIYNNVDLNWKKILSLCFKTTHDTMLQWFQVRIIHRILATQSFLFNCKLSTSQKCSFCNQEIETIHLFWQCDAVKCFWNNLEM